MAKTELGHQFETFVAKPGLTSKETIKMALNSALHGVGEATIFEHPGQTLSTTVTASHFLEAKEFDFWGRDKFLSEIIKHINRSPCVIIRWIPSATADRKH